MNNEYRGDRSTKMTIHHFLITSGLTLRVVAH